MTEKKEMIKNGNDISLDEGNVVVINNGISLSEKSEEISQPDVNVEAPVADIIPEVAPITLDPSVPLTQAAPIIPEAPSIEVPVPSIEPIATPTTDISQSVINAFDDVKIPMNNTGDVGGFLYPGVGMNIDSRTPEQANDNTDFFESGVYKSSNDVEIAKAAFLKDVEAAYDKNIVAPTKAVVELLNSFVNWGNEVTRQGLNRPLFEEFDNLKDRYNGLKTATYGDEEPSNNFGGMNY